MAPSSVGRALSEPAMDGDDADGEAADGETTENTDAHGSLVDADDLAADAGDDAADDSVVDLPVLPDVTPRREERAAARLGLIESAPPVFAPAARVPLAGVFLALPALHATGLLASARDVYGGLPNGFCGLDAMLVEGVLRCLLGESRAEGASRVAPVALGRVLGLGRAPETSTIRRRIGLLAQEGKAAELLAAGAARHLAGAGGQDTSLLLYVDGHVRAYQGTRKIGKTHLAGLCFPAPATVETWVSDAAGGPVLVVMAQPGGSLAGELRRLLPELRGAVGDDRRVLVGFDRGGWSPALFAQMIKAGFDVLTWRKGPAPDIAPEKFVPVTHVDGQGLAHVHQIAESTVDLPTDRSGGVLRLRQVTHLAAGGRQLHMLTSRTDLPPGEVNHRMGSRWRQENYFRYACAVRRCPIRVGVRDRHRRSCRSRSVELGAA